MIGKLGELLVSGIDNLCSNSIPKMVHICNFHHCSIKVSSPDVKRFDMVLDWMLSNIFET